MNYKKLVNKLKKTINEMTENATNLNTEAKK